MSTILSDNDNKFQILCYDSLGMQNGQIPNASITATSNFGSAHRARLYNVAGDGKPGAWVAALSDSSQWLQVRENTSFWYMTPKFFLKKCEFLYPELNEEHRTTVPVLKKL